MQEDVNVEWIDRTGAVPLVYVQTPAPRTFAFFLGSPWTGLCLWGGGERVGKHKSQRAKMRSQENYRPRYTRYCCSRIPAARAKASFERLYWYRLSIKLLCADATVACASTSGRLSSTPAFTRSVSSLSARVASSTFDRATSTSLWAESTSSSADRTC